LSARHWREAAVIGREPTDGFGRSRGQSGRLICIRSSRLTPRVTRLGERETSPPSSLWPAPSS
jgi:hypothetical protein